jgi:hypothetical protein
MLDFIPKLVQERYGRVEETVFNGPVLILDLITRAKLSPCFGTAGSPFKGMTP